MTEASITEKEPEATREHKHYIIDEWKITATGHYKLCARCFEILEAGDHEWEFISIVQKGDETTPGIKRFGCKICHHTKLVQTNLDGTKVDLTDLPVW